MRIATLAVAIAALLAGVLNGAESKGKVQFGGLPLPGATITATQGDRTLTAVTDQDGSYVFPDLPDGVWNFQVEMLGFSPIKQEVTLAAGAGAPPEWDLKLLPFDEIKAMAAPSLPPPPRVSVTPPVETSQNNGDAAKNQKNSKNNKKTTAAAAVPANGQNTFQRAAVNANPNAAAPPAAEEAPAANSAFTGQSAGDLSQRASDGLLINGTVNNGASSPFAQAAAFGNNRRGAGSLYNGNIGFILDNSALDARTFSYTGQNTPKPGYNHIQGVANFGGPIRIPHLIQNGPIFFIGYQWTRNHTAQTNSYLVPTDAQRAGDFSLFPTALWNPTVGAPFAGNQIPASLISPQALALIKFFPEPNFTGSPQYNYQLPIVGETHQDALNSRLNKNIGNKNSLYGFFAFQRTATDSPNEFGFLDKTSALGVVAQANWQRRLNSRMFLHFQVQFSRNSTDLTPNFANRENVSGEAGVTGNNQQPVNYGPPSLSFSGISPLSDGNSSVVHNQTSAFTFDGTWIRGRHQFQYGTDFKRVEFNSIGQQNPRGSFQFTGAYTAPPSTGSGTPVLGSDFADFLLGVPDTSAIAFGNADKYFRESLWDGFLNDTWRIGPSLTVTPGIRWDYQAPITELYGRLVNLDTAPGYSDAVPVQASSPTGPLTGIKYPDSLLQPDKHAFQPRVALAWRPIPASSLVVRASYGVYYNTSVYQSIANLMSQQYPLSKSLSVSNKLVATGGGLAPLLTLANGFTVPPNTFTDTFGVDPNFKVGYAQIWDVSVQRDLPASLVMTADYQGTKGTRGPQEFLPNTYPEGAVSPCQSCPTGFIYMTSNGNSTRQQGSLQLRRRLHNGFTASVTYTYSKSIDDSALGGRGQGSNVIAQNWLDLSAERGLSNFDQRHVVAFTTQYTTGQGIGGGTLLSGWRGALFKEWQVATTINAGTGLPLTPTVFVQSPGTAITGPVRPDYTGAPLYAAPAGFELNPQAYIAAPLGQWGNAGRNSIEGPDQFSLNASLARTFRLKDRYSMDLRIDSTNTLNHVTFASWNTVINGGQFGLPTPPANAMRSLQTTLRLRF